ncbi:MAG: transcription antitermination factor NusB [Deltaproteobacteria bacterium]|nr:transcription antitermination factor NusB [Deltaproteobacteria bacterium]
MGTRRKGREIALQVLYQIDITGVSRDAALQEFKNHFKVKKESWSFAEALIKGICEHMKTIDALIEGESEHWKLGRMSLTDRNILRLAAYELLHMEGIPSKVTINEAIELGKLYGTEESGAFINGILDKVFKSRNPGEKKTG